LLALPSATYSLERAATSTLSLTTSLTATAENGTATSSEAAGPGRCARVVNDRECGLFFGCLNSERVLGVCAIDLLF